MRCCLREPMSNRICNTKLEIRKLSQVEAEVWIHVEVALVAPDTEVRGKLVGPRSPGITTVEVAYPFQRMSRPQGAAENILSVRAAIDEPNLWTEKSPFVYEGVVELWQDRRCC